MSSILTLGEIRTRVEWTDKHKNPARGRMVDATVNEVYQKLWSSHLYSWRRKQGQIRTRANYSTGTAAITQGQTTVTITTGVITADMGDWVFQIDGDVRDYPVASWTDATHFELQDPYEGTTQTVGTYTLKKRNHRLPFDYDRAEVQKESTGNRWLWWRTMASLEADVEDPVTSGQPNEIIPAGVTQYDVYSTGKVGLTYGSRTMTGTTTSWLSARDKGLPVVIRGYPMKFPVETVNTTTSITLGFAWPYSTLTNLEYVIGPKGWPVVQLRPHLNGDRAVRFWYFAKLPPLVFDWDVPQIPEERHSLLIDATLERLNLAAPGTLKAGIAEMLAADGVSAQVIGQMERWGAASPKLPSALDGAYPFYNPLTGGY